MRAVVGGLWRRVHEPRVIAVAYFVIYIMLAVGGLTALLDPPTSISGEIGDAAMAALAGLLTFGGTVGAIAVLPGRNWLERDGVLAIAVASVLYAAIVVSLQVGSPGNRLLQLAFIVTVGLMQLIRWQRIKDRPYDPDRRVPPPTSTDAA